MDGLAGGLEQVLQEGQGRLPQVEPVRDERAELEELRAEPVVGARALQPAEPYEVRRQLVDRRLGQAGALREFRQPERTATRAEGIQDERRSSPRPPWARTSSRRSTGTPTSTPRTSTWSPAAARPRSRSSPRSTPSLPSTTARSSHPSPPAQRDPAPGRTSTSSPRPPPRPSRRSAAPRAARRSSFSTRQPPLIMRDTVHCLVSGCDEAAVSASVEEMVGRVQAYVPGYRLKQKVQFDRVRPDDPLRTLAPDASGGSDALKVSVFLEVEGAAHYLPAYAGNLDIMTSAALRTAERMAALPHSRLRSSGGPPLPRRQPSDLSLRPGRDPPGRHARRPAPLHHGPGPCDRRRPGRRGRGRHRDRARRRSGGLQHQLRRRRAHRLGVDRGRGGRHPARRAHRPAAARHRHPARSAAGAHPGHPLGAHRHPLHRGRHLRPAHRRRPRSGHRRRRVPDDVPPGRALPNSPARPS